MIVLFDDLCARGFEPFASTRPLGEMRVGALLIRERWAHRLGTSISSFVGAPHLAAFTEFDSPPAARGTLPVGTIIAHARAVPFLVGVVGSGADAHIDGWQMDGRLAAVRLSAALDSATLARGEMTLESLVVPTSVLSIEGVWLDEVWDIVRHLHALLLHDIPALAASLACAAFEDTDSDARGPVVLGGHPVWLEAGARVEPYAVFDTTLGPVLLRDGAVVQAFTRVVGPCYVGRSSTVMADRISGSSIGDHCRVHGELSATVMIGHANKGHDGFVGHSVLGRWVNLGAGTVTSNLKNTYGNVALWTPTGVRDTGLQFLGTLFGDHTKTGIGLRLTTGCVLGAGANVMDGMPPKVVAPFSWGTRVPYDVYALPKFLETAERVMSRRAVTMDAAQRAHLTHVYAFAIANARWFAR